VKFVRATAPGILKTQYSVYQPLFFMQVPNQDETEPGRNY